MFKGGRPTFRGYAEHGSTLRSIDYLGKDMNETDWKIPAIKYHQLHGLDSRTPIPKRNAYLKNEIENIPIDEVESILKNNQIRNLKKVAA